jgi:RNA polymerase sigma-70 factor (ECF subfamily)
MTIDEQKAIFQNWLSHHLGLMLNVVRASTAAPQDQDDLFQDVLINLWSSIPNFRGEAKETTWIYRVAFNTAQVWRRGERQRQKKQQRFFTDSAVAEPSSVSDGTPPKSELIDRLHAAIRQLPKVDSALAIMYLDGVPYKEMSEVLGISENYIGVKLNRIRKCLTDQLQGDSDEL